MGAPDGKEHLEVFRGYSPNGITGHAAATARLDALAFNLDNPTGARRGAGASIGL